MTRAKRSNINDNNKIDSTEPIEDSSIQKNPALWKTILLIILPGYIYFFGYSSHVYFLNGIGFSSPSIPFDVGAAYLHAYHSLLFAADLALTDFETKYFKQLHDSWLTTFIISSIVALVTIVVGWLLIKKRKKNKINNTATKPSLSISHPPLTMKKLFLVSGIGMFTINFLTFLLLPIFVAILVLPTIFLIIPAALGTRMGADEVKEFSCERYKNHRYLPCATIEFRDKTQITGRIYL